MCFCLSIMLAHWLPVTLFCQVADCMALVWHVQLVGRYMSLYFIKITTHTHPRNSHSTWICGYSHTLPLGCQMVTTRCLGQLHNIHLIQCNMHLVDVKFTWAVTLGCGQLIGHIFYKWHILLTAFLFALLYICFYHSKRKTLTLLVAAPRLRH